MELKLIHPFLNRAHDLQALLKDTNKLSTFCNKLEKQSELFPNRYEPNKYKGDGFELFSEVLIKLSPIDTRIGISNYEPITVGDIGVDGKGISMIDGEPVTVQIKYRRNPIDMLTIKDLHNFQGASFNLFNVPVHPSTKHMFIITAANGLHHFTENEMYGNSMHVIGYESLRALVDNNQAFWNAFRELTK